MIELDNRVNFPFSTNFLNLLEEILKIYTQREIELIITDNSEIKELNLEFRGKDLATDVLSFPLEDMPFSPLGSIVISQEFVKNGAKRYNHSIEDEFTLLFIHGLLHLIGYDHEKDEKMRKEEEKIIKKFNLPKSLIVRNEECY